MSISFFKKNFIKIIKKINELKTKIDIKDQNQV